MTSLMLKWSQSKNVHVRRLSSEGIRPRLPWAKKLRPIYLRSETNPTHTRESKTG